MRQVWPRRNPIPSTNDSNGSTRAINPSHEKNFAVNTKSAAAAKKFAAPVTSRTRQKTNLQKFTQVNGWVRLNRTEEAMELIHRNPLAFTLAAVIAMRARWSDGNNRFDLAKGEAMLGDFEQCGMTQKQYRTAKRILAKWGLVAFRRTNRGTIARLTDSRLFSISDGRKGEQKGNQKSNMGQAQGDQAATNKQSTKTVINYKEGNNETAKPLMPLASLERTDEQVSECSASNEKANLPPPTIDEVERHFMTCHISISKAARANAEYYHERMTFNDWKYKGDPIGNWMKHSIKYMNGMNQHLRVRVGRNAGTFNASSGPYTQSTKFR